MPTNNIPYLRCCKRKRKRGTAVDLRPRIESQAQDNEAKASQRAIRLGVGIPCLYLTSSLVLASNTLRRSNLAHLLAICRSGLV